MKRVLVIAGILAGIGALAWYLKHQANLLMQYCFNFTGAKIINFSRERITIEVKLQIKNKSDLDITISGYDFDVFLNGAYATHVSSNKQTKVAKRSFSTLALLIDIEPKKNKDLANWDFLARLLLDVNNIKVKIKGTVSATALGINATDVPVDLEMKIKEMMPDKQNPSPPCK
jgi:LEA14-like dessication related protein